METHYNPSGYFAPQQFATKISTDYHPRLGADSHQTVYNASVLAAESTLWWLHRFRLAPCSSKKVKNVSGSTQAQSQVQAITPETLKSVHVEGLIEDAYRDGEVKPEWQYLLNSLEELGPAALRDRQDKARRILRDDGATYNIYDQSGTQGSSWELDLVPSVIGSQDWAVIEAGLLERAELFNLMLRDLYGPRTLLRHRALPPEALFSHAGFLRACQGIQLPGEHELVIHAVDMARCADGSMCVLSDRTQAPSGAGYVLENRTVMSRILPSLFRDSHVHRISNYYQRLRLKLLSLAPNADVPRIVVLTPGAHNETYFEHAHLANYLGYPLVQSGDLMVRNGYVWMKSLSGLSRVDVIMRRVDDAFCDPVELRSDSHLGIPGLLEVVRAKRVAIANPLGSGVLENPVLLKYLPEISKTLLGREPRLKSVPTYWAGDDKDLAYINRNLDKLIVKQIYRNHNSRSLWPEELTKEQQDELRARIKQDRFQYVAQERLEKSHIPSFNGTHLEPRPTILRTFAVASEGSYTVMPGGLTRIGLKPKERFISMQAGCPSKDTWVTATEPERASDIGPSLDPLKTGSDSQLISLPSRVVENLYWLGRYAERAEASLRILRTVFMLLNGEESISLQARRIILSAVSEITATGPGFKKAPDAMLMKPEEELKRIIEDGDRLGSVRSTLNSLLYCADEAKELLSSDTLRVTNDLRDALDNLAPSLASGLASAPEEALDPLVTSLIALSGLMQESMVRDVGWRFMELGRRVERAMQIIATIKTLITPVTEGSGNITVLTAMLTSMEVLITYRRRHRARLSVDLGLELVMLDASNPRSLLFQFEQLQQHFAKLPPRQDRGLQLDEDERALLEAITSLKLSRLAQLLETESTEREELKTLLEKLSTLLSAFNNIISDRYFDHRVDAQQLVTTFWGE